MLPKEFIRDVLTEGIKDIVNKNPYLSFCLIAIGIEFLGKCLLSNEDWHKKSSTAFNKGLKLFPESGPYSKLKLANALRNGFAHTLSPKSGIVLSERKYEGGKGKHLIKDSAGRTILIAENFYEDFVVACKKVCEMEFLNDDKMNKPFLNIKAVLLEATENAPNEEDGLPMILHVSTSSAF